MYCYKYIELYCFDERKKIVQIWFLSLLSFLNKITRSEMNIKNFKQHLISNLEPVKVFIKVGISCTIIIVCRAINNCQLLFSTIAYFVS